MTTTAADPQIVPHQPAAAPALLAADQGVASALESVLAGNTQRVYAAQWRIFTDWCDSVVLRSLPAQPLTVARYLAVRANAGASIATMRLATSAIAKAHEWTGHESPCKDRGVRASLKGWGRRLAKPQRQAGALTADVLSVIRLTAPKPRARGRGLETAEQAGQRGKFDVALVAVLSDGGLRRSEASSLTWGDVVRWDDGSGRITVVRSKTGGPGPGRRGGRHSRRHESVGRHPAGGGSQRRQSVRAVGVPDRPAGEGDRQGRRSGGLGVLQRPQRARGHGAAHGPERRAHPRDRAPGSLETGRWHGRPLHPRGVSWVSAAVSIAVSWR